MGLLTCILLAPVGDFSLVIVLSMALIQFLFSYPEPNLPSELQYCYSVWENGQEMVMGCSRPG